MVSNRLPPTSEIASGVQERAGPVGGLVSALKPAMQEHGGVWLGWSGTTSQRRPDPTPNVSDYGQIQLATIGMSEDEVSLYYTGFANRTLWPLLHSFPGRIVIRRDTYRAYRRINQRFATALCSILEPGDVVWVHDYHLFHLGQELRDLGWTGKIGFFLHVPFPSSDILSILPWSRDILEALLHYDLVGFHTERYLRNLIDALREELGVVAINGKFRYNGNTSKLGVYPIGIDPTIFQTSHDESGPSLAQQVSMPLTSTHRIILGVDRLDYTKGIPERLMAFERLLESRATMRSRVSFVQISSPSRTRIPEYIAEKDRVDQLVGQINGRFSEPGWIPIRYLYRSYPQTELAHFYRDADVCMVTPLRDGMNLVAKEFVAAQGEDPGVLVLSKFSGAASTMSDALIVNPYDIDGTAEALYRALRMDREERVSRWKTLMDNVRDHTAWTWSDSFRTDLEQC